MSSLPRASGNSLARKTVPRTASADGFVLETFTNPKPIAHEEWRFTDTRYRLMEADFLFERLQSPDLSPEALRSLYHKALPEMAQGLASKLFVVTSEFQSLASRL